MTFWDASVLVSLVVTDEPKSSQADEWYQADSRIFAWTLSPVEILSGIYRKVRESRMNDENLWIARSRWKDLVEMVTFITSIEDVKRAAGRVLALHPLRASDALQLAAALVACGHETSAHVFLTFDERLKSAALKEGFRVGLDPTSAER